MKSNYILLLLFILGFHSDTEGQLLNKFKKKAEQALMNKVGNALENETEKAIDSLLANDEQTEGMTPPPPDKNIQIPEQYAFTYKTTIQVSNHSGKHERTYFLEPDSNYYAILEKLNEFDQYVVYDNDRNMEVVFAEIDGIKYTSRKKMDIMTMARQHGAFKDSPNTNTLAIGSKKILDYECNGYKITSDAGSTEIWITNEVPASPFSSLFKRGANNPGSPFTGKSMIMEMTYTSEVESKRNYKMECTTISSTEMKFQLDDYKE